MSKITDSKVIMKDAQPLILLVWDGEPSANRFGSGFGIAPYLLPDCRALRRVLHKHGYTAKYADIHDAWEEYCAEDMSSAWLDVNYSEETTIKALLKYLKEPTDEQRIWPPTNHTI